ncbi:MAG: Uma2 family endonuclease [Anaerolineales bacterium]|nr:Uma2 family endonuclease [Anaerolineales bacterium]
MTAREAVQPGGRLKMSYDEFLAWAGEDLHAEWVNGEVIVHMTAKQKHQDIVRFLLELFGLFNQFFRLGYFAMAPRQMKLSPEGPGREPDILFVAQEHADRITEEMVIGPADLVVEIVSEDSVTRDRVEKLEEYEHYGVREYWIIDPRARRPRAEFYQLDERGQYQPVPIGPDGRYHSKVLPGFWLNVNWLWSEPLPDAFFAFAEIANLPADIVDGLRRLQRK